MAYPTRGAWRFRNADRAFDFWPTLDSILISQELPDMTATLSCRVVDEDASLVFAVEDKCWITFAGERIWSGHLKAVGEDREDEFGPRVWELEGQDYTAKLDDAIIHRRKKRKREKARRRVKWLLRQLDRRVWTLAGRDLSHIPDAWVEAYDYYGASVDEGLAHVADELRLHYYIDLDNVFQMYRTDAVAAPFDLDNEAPDKVTTFPFREWRSTDDSVELANAILVEPEKRKHARWSKDQTSIAAYGRQERFISDSNIHRAAQALAVGARTLADTKDPEVEATLVTFEPGLQAGMKVHVREALWDHDFLRYISAVDIRAVDPHDDDGLAYLATEATVGPMWRKRRRNGNHGHRRDRSINRLARRRPGQTADADPHVIDRFRRVVAPPTWAAGDAIVSGAMVDSYEASRGLSVDRVTEIPFSTHPGTVLIAASYIGQWYLPHTDPDNPCDGLSNFFAGWMDRERWFTLAIPAHPAGMAGITVELVNSPTGNNDGVGPQHGARIVVLSAEPTDTWQGTEVGHLGNGGTTTVFIPGALVPAAGGTLHLGVQAGWACSYGATACGWVWPYHSGEGNSGKLAVMAQDATWATWTDAGGDMGSIAVFPSDAPWDGGNAWREAGIEGSPVFGVDTQGYYVTSTGLGGRGLYVVGEREEETEPRGPWSDCAWAVQFMFQVDADGDTATAGPRHIQIVTTSEGEQVVGTVHLGDSARAAGISVGGPTTTAYAAKAISLDEWWRAKFDSRSGRMRGKLWRVGDQEPTTWDVEVPMAETEDDADRVTLWVRCGNATAQTVRIRDIFAWDDAQDGKRVVRELLGSASGLTNRFKTNHPFREGTLVARVNGINVPPASEDGDATDFWLDFCPTAGSVIRATYIVDQGGDVAPPLVIAVTEGTPSSSGITISWSLSEPGTGQVEYGPTSALGSVTTLEADLLSWHSQAIAGLAAGTQYYYRVVSEDAAGNTVTASGDFTTSGSAPAATGNYGPAIAADGKGNLIMRPDADGECGYLFKALVGGEVTDIRFECTNREPPYYGGGDAGVYRVGIQSLTAGLPSGTWLGDYGTWDPVVTPGNFAVRVPITGGPTLTAGMSYAVVIQNVHASPNANWSSMNNPWNRYAADQPMFPDNSVVKGGPSAWEAISYYLPAFDVEYASGEHEGMAAITAQDVDTPSAYIGHVNSTSKGCWSFTPPAGAPSRTAAAVQFFMRKGTGSTNATVVVKKDGATVATGVFSTSGAMPAGSHSWQRAVLSSPVTFEAGDAIRVEVSVTAGEFTLPTVLWRDSYPASGPDCLASWPYSENAGANIHRADDGAAGTTPAYSAWYVHTTYQCYLELT